MYCKYCGKPTDNASGVCDECAASREQGQTAEQASSAVEPNGTVQPTQQPQPTQTVAPAQPAPPAKMTRMYFFGPALASTILGAIGYLLAFCGLIWVAQMLGTESASAPSGYYYTYYYTFLGQSITRETYISISTAVSVIGFIMGVAALVLGILSIKASKRARAAGVRAVPTKVLGIVGTVAASVTVFFALLVFMLMGSV